MSPILKKPSFFLEYVLLRFVQQLLIVIPRPVALKFGAFTGSILHALGIYRHIVRTNLEHVGLWDNAEMNRITRALYRNTGRYAVDFLRPVFPAPPHEIVNYNRIAPVLSADRGVIAVLGHLGNWELLPSVFEKTGKHIYAVAQTMNNTIVDKWLFDKRTALSVTTIPTDNALRKMFEALRSGGAIAILIDQFTKKHGTPVPFLGREANTIRTVAGIVRKTGCNVVSTCAVIRPGGDYIIQTFDVPAPDLSGSPENEAIEKLQKLHNDVISEQIRQYPEHWFGWFHRRFRGYADYSR